jgi:hypothetical protein
MLRNSCRFLNRVFGQGYADVVAAVMISASMDWAATTIRLEIEKATAPLKARALGPS